MGVLFLALGLSKMMSPSSDLAFCMLGYKMSALKNICIILKNVDFNVFFYWKQSGWSRDQVPNVRHDIDTSLLVFIKVHVHCISAPKWKGFIQII